MFSFYLFKKEKWNYRIITPYYLRILRFKLYHSPHPKIIPIIRKAHFFQKQKSAAISD